MELKENFQQLEEVLVAKSCPQAFADKNQGSNRPRSSSRGRGFGTIAARYGRGPAVGFWRNAAKLSFAAEARKAERENSRRQAGIAK